MGSVLDNSAAVPASGTGATATTKLRPPAVPAPLLQRDRLMTLLAGALERRLTVVVADAGFGKSTLLSAWSADVNCAWYTASADDSSLAAFARGVTDALRLRVPALSMDGSEAVTATAGPGAEQDEPARARGFAAAVCETLQAELRRDLVLVLDDVQDLTGSAGAVKVLEALCRQAPVRLHIVLASRSELPFPIERLRGQGQVLELTGADLAFTVDETATLLAGLVGSTDADTVAALQSATGGWPAAVRLAAEALRGVAPNDRAGTLERIRRPGGPLLGYLAAEVFAHEAPEVEALIRTIAPLERFNAELCETLGVASARTILPSLARRGLFVELQGRMGDWYALGQPVKEFALSQSRLDEARNRRVRIEAAAWFEQRDEPEEALRCLAAAGDVDGIARLLASNGQELLARGATDAVLDAIDLVRPGLRTPQIEQLAGEAFQVRGDWDEALRCFDRAAGSDDLLSPGLAWRMGLLRHLGGRLDEAMRAYDRAREDGDARDLALLLAWRASAHWLRGDAGACRTDAKRAFAIASDAGDPRALAAAHTVLAMLAALEGDRSANDAHYLRALDYAGQAGDVLQLIRVRTNRGSRHLEEGHYEEAIAELDIALRLADIAGFASFRALALTNRGEARAKLGRFEEAVADLEASRELYQRLGSRMVAYPLEKLGDLYRTRGEWALSRAAYEEAVSHADAAGDLQGLVPSLAGLARVVVADEPEEAERLVNWALSFDPGMNHVQALLTAGWVALARDDRDAAARRAAEAAAEAGVRRDRAALAESLELRALATHDADDAASRLEEAASIWHDLLNPAGEARAELAAARLRGDDTAAADAEDRLQALGIRGHRGARSRAATPRGASVAIYALGRFGVDRDGSVVPQAAWQSRKARDLFKILLARRGRPTPRDALMETLWPGQSAGPLGNRLSVLLSTVRSVLDPDKRHAADHFVGADRNAIWLRLEHVSVDFDEFVAAAEAALASSRAGDAAATAHLVAAEALYTGDFLEEDAYEDWAIAPREEGRTVYTEIVRALGRGALANGDTDAAIRYHLRVLERDPYDEQAYLGLVTALEVAGRHGEARRQFRAYCARMDEIGVESAPFPTVERNARDAL